MLGEGKVGITKESISTDNSDSEKCHYVDVQFVITGDKKLSREFIKVLDKVVEEVNRE